MRKEIHGVSRLARLALCLIAIVVCLFLGSCGGDSDDIWIPPRDVRGPFFDSYGFSQENGRPTYKMGSAVATRTGVDVSEYQGNIDWEAVASDGISFAILRLGYRGSTEGQLYRDESFDHNLSAAQDAGLDCGAYFYSQAKSVEEAEEEARFAVEILSGRELQYPVAFDYEPTRGSRIQSVDKATATECARAFCDVLMASGYEVTLYGNTYDLALFDSDVLSDIPLWVAEYSDVPSYTYRFEMWQYTNEGGLQGIEGGVDLNLDMRDAIQDNQH